MDDNANILLIDDDKALHSLLNDALTDFNLISAYSGNEALEIVKIQLVDIILLDVNMGGMTGYDVCKQIRTQESDPPVPILFLSGKKSLEDILNGYESGGTDYITKPFKLAELIAKIKVAVNEFQLERNLQTSLNEVTEAVLTVQDGNAKIYAICRFLQQSFFCKNIDTLCQLFFTVTESFDTDATIYIHSQENNSFFSSNGKQHPMSNAVLEQAHSHGGRIFQFGNGRAIFNWESTSVLINRVRDDADNIAMLMDGFEMGLKAIEASNHFEKILTNYRELKHQQSTEVTKAFDDVVDEIQDELGQVGYNTLSEEQEDALIRIVESKRVMVDGLFSQGLKLDEELSSVMNKLRSENTDEQTEDNDGIDFL